MYYSICITLYINTLYVLLYVLYYTMCITLYIYVCFMYIQGGQTSLHIAVLNGHHGITEALLEHGADANIKDRVRIYIYSLTCDGVLTFLCSACICRYMNLLYVCMYYVYMCSLCIIYIYDTFIIYIHVYICVFMYVSCIYTQIGNAPLHFAADKGYESIITLLLGKGADVNIKDNGVRINIYAAYIICIHNY